MVEGFGRVREPEGVDRLFRSWRAVVSAWAIVLGIVILLAGVYAFRGSPVATNAVRSAVQAGAVIPRHDPVCTGAVLAEASPPESCRAAAAARAPQEDPFNANDW